MEIHKKKFIGTIALIACLILITLIVSFMNYKKNNVSYKVLVDNKGEVEQKDAKGQKDVKVSNIGTIKVYINGEVKKPGVYTLKLSSRIEDLVSSAGGFTEEADSLKINEAKILKDEDYIYVPKIVKGAINGEGSINPVKPVDDGKININEATKEQLMTLPRIGEVTATKIIEYREKNGPFKSIEDLKQVSRIGDKTLEDIKDKIEVR